MAGAESSSSAALFSWDAGNAAGSTRSSGSDYGLRLSRGALAGTPSKGFDVGAWAGSWAMNHDGWRGTLDVSSAALFAATYTAVDGKTLAVTGGARRGAALLMTLVRLSQRLPGSGVPNADRLAA